MPPGHNRYFWCRYLERSALVGAHTCAVHPQQARNAETAVGHAWRRGRAGDLWWVERASPAQRPQLRCSLAAAGKPGKPPGPRTLSHRAFGLDSRSACAVTPQRNGCGRGWRSTLARAAEVMMSSSGLTQNRCVLCLSLPAAQSGAHSQTARAEKVRLHARCVVSKRETRQRLQRTSQVVPKSDHSLCSRQAGSRLSAAGSGADWAHSCQPFQRFQLAGSVPHR